MRQGKEYLEQGARAAESLGKTLLAREMRSIAADLPNVRTPEQARELAQRLRPLKTEAWELGRQCDRLLVWGTDAIIALAGSAAWRVWESGLTVLVERVTGFDRWGLPDLAVIAQPVRWHGRLAKVLLVAVPVGDRSLLEIQLAQGPVKRVPLSFQLI